MSSDFRARLRRREPLLGTIVSLPSPSVAEILAESGFDWLFLDGEHGALETGDLLGILQAVSGRIPCVVRVPVAEETPIKKVLDLGAAGIIAPQVNTAEHAARVVRYARYQPLGERGVGIARAHGYGFRFEEYVQSANDSVSVVVQAEHIEAVGNIDSIVQVDGVDAVLLGPYDLSASLGKMGQVHDPVVTGAIDRVTAACDQAGMPLGYFGVTADAVRQYMSRGYSLLVAAADTVFLGAAARDMITELREAD